MNSGISLKSEKILIELDDNSVCADRPLLLSHITFVLQNRLPLTPLNQWIGRSSRGEYPPPPPPPPPSAPSAPSAPPPLRPLPPPPPPTHTHL